MSNSSDHPLKQLFQAVDPEGQVSEDQQQELLKTFEAMLGEDWNEVSQQMGLLLADFADEPAPQANPQPIEAASQSVPQTSVANHSILPQLAQNIEAATGLAAQIPVKPGDEAFLNLLRQLDFHLAEAALGVSDLNHAGQVNSSASGEPSDTSSAQADRIQVESPEPRRRWQMPWQILMAAGLILLPFGLKFGLPRLIQTASITTPQATNLYTVAGVTDQTIQVQQNGKTQNLQLLGLAASAPSWQAEANGVIVMLLKSSGGQIQLENVVPQSGSNQIGAIARLPNGTSLQEVLLSGGLAQLDRQQLSQMSKEVAATLEQAQATAQSQHKNIWGQSP